MSIASAIQTKQQQIAEAYTACAGKGATMPATEDLTNLATCINSISGSSSGKYQLLERVEDDNGNEIGTVAGFFTDINDVEYAVVVLDAIYRQQRVESYMNAGSNELTHYPSAYEIHNPHNTPYSATFYTQKVLDYVEYYNTHEAEYDDDKISAPYFVACRNISFTIDNVVYYGQVMNCEEMAIIAKHINELNSLDPHIDDDYDGISYPTGPSDLGSSNLSIEQGFWWCYNSDYEWGMSATFELYSTRIFPILEIPNS